MASFGLKIFWTFFSGDAVMEPFRTKLAMMITCLCYLLLAGMLYASLRGNENAKFYFGFLDGKLSKAFFLLFCSFLVYPLSYDGSSPWKTIFVMGAIFLTFISVLQITKFCCSGSNDVHEDEAMMDNAGNHNRGQAHLV